MFICWVIVRPFIIDHSIPIFHPKKEEENSASITWRMLQRLSAGQVLGDAKNPVEGGKDEDNDRNAPLSNHDCLPAIQKVMFMIFTRIFTTDINLRYLREYLQPI